MSDYDVDLSDLYADLADIDVNPSDTFVVIWMALTGQEHFFLFFNKWMWQFVYNSFGGKGEDNSYMISWSMMFYYDIVKTGLSA